VNPLLQAWLTELRADGLFLSDEPGAGANQNLWCISLPSSEQIPAGEVLAFLRSALHIRRELVASQSLAPVTFYAWHDEMAGQLRFSTACCTRDALPFAAWVQLVDEPDEIIGAFLRSPYRDGIPWTEMEDAPPDGNGVTVHTNPLCLKVWAVALS
jgi:hypothetical protein